MRIYLLYPVVETVDDPFTISSSESVDDPFTIIKIFYTYSYLIVSHSKFQLCYKIYI